MRGDVADAVRDRSGGRCEARWHVGYRCRNSADHIHHALPKSRGGRLLDDVGCMEHLWHLCQPCHTDVHGNPERAYTVRLLIYGYVLSDLGCVPTYVGPDPVLSVMYPMGETHATQ